jgi:uncharacterized membrane protein YqjE
MDDKKVFELKRLELAYSRQIVFMCGMILMTLMGLVLYIINIYQYNFQLLMISIVLLVVGITSILNIDTALKEISRKIKGL